MPVLVQTASHYTFGSTSITITFGANITPGNLVAVVTLLANATSTSSLSAVESWIQPASAFVRGNTGTFSTLTGFYVLSATGGWNSVTASFTVPGSGTAVIAWEISGASACQFITGNVLQHVTTNLTSLAAGGTVLNTGGVILTMACKEDTAVGISSLGGGSWVQDGVDNASGLISTAFAHYINPPRTNQQPTLTYFANAGGATSLAMLFSPPAPPAGSFQAHIF